MPFSNLGTDSLFYLVGKDPVTCTGEIASKLLVLGARPFGKTPGGGCRALFITLLQLATMVKIVSDSS